MLKKSKSVNFSIDSEELEAKYKKVLGFNPNEVNAEKLGWLLTANETASRNIKKTANNGVFKKQWLKFKKDTGKNIDSETYAIQETIKDQFENEKVGDKSWNVYRFQFGNDNFNIVSKNFKQAVATLIMVYGDYLAVNEKGGITPEDISEGEEVLSGRSKMNAYVNAIKWNNKKAPVEKPAKKTREEVLAEDTAKLDEEMRIRKNRLAVDASVEALDKEIAKAKLAINKLNKKLKSSVNNDAEYEKTSEMIDVLKTNISKMNKKKNQLENTQKKEEANASFSLKALTARVARVNNFACTGKWTCPECGEEMKGDECKCGYHCKKSNEK